MDSEQQSSLPTKRIQCNRVSSNTSFDVNVITIVIMSAVRLSISRSRTSQLLYDIVLDRCVSGVCSCIWQSIRCESKLESLCSWCMQTNGNKKLSCSKQIAAGSTYVLHDAQTLFLPFICGNLLYYKSRQWSSNITVDEQQWQVSAGAARWPALRYTRHVLYKYGRSAW